MTKNLVYYITGHGLGHARRSAQVIAELIRLRSDLAIHIRTSAPTSAFADVLGPSVTHHPVELDPGAVEDDPLRINPLATRDRVQAKLDQSASLIGREVRFLRRHKAALLLADIPFLAGDIAAAAAIPSIAITNFTWDWIYEGWTDGKRSSPFNGLIQRIQASYAHIGAILKLPFGGRTDMFPEVTEVPLIVNRLSRPRAQTRRLLTPARADRRPLVLAGQRGGIDHKTLLKAARQTPEIRFLTLQPLPGPLPDNITVLSLTPDLPFADVLAASDVVVSKFGYGIVADSIASKVGILWPARVGFREDVAMTTEATPFLRHQMISAKDFRSGNWRDSLLSLLAQRPPRRTLPTTGAATCAQLILARL